MSCYVSSPLLSLSSWNRQLSLGQRIFIFFRKILCNNCNRSNKNQHIVCLIYFNNISYNAYKCLSWKTFFNNFVTVHWKLKQDILCIYNVKINKLPLHLSKFPLFFNQNNYLKLSSLPLKYFLFVQLRLLKKKFI